MAHAHDRSRHDLRGLQIFAADLPAPLRSWFESWEGQPTIWVRWDLLDDLTEIVGDHLRAPTPAARQP